MSATGLIALCILLAVVVAIIGFLGDYFDRGRDALVAKWFRKWKRKSRRRNRKIAHR